jgi:hypothetical protein
MKVRFPMLAGAASPAAADPTAFDRPHPAAGFFMALVLLLPYKITISVLTADFVAERGPEVGSSPESESVASGSEKEIRILRASMPPILSSPC